MTEPTPTTPPTASPAIVAADAKPCTGEVKTAEAASSCATTAPAAAASTCSTPAATASSCSTETAKTEALPKA